MLLFVWIIAFLWTWLCELYHNQKEFVVSIFDLLSVAYLMNCFNLDIADLLVKNATVTKTKTIENSTLEYRYFVENGITWL